ncbi:MAG: signal recognition particle protein [Proteobacteria bacterium]|nr:signal recognition particle protein [Pseudomonadota bacterium]
MFNQLTKNIGKALDRLRGKGYITEADVNEAMREIRLALLEADVALPVVREFVGRIKEKAVGAEVLKSVSAAQMIVKIVHEELVEMLGGQIESFELNYPAPAVLMLLGLQGSGKTTSAAKLAYYLRKKHKKKILLASADTYRPAAQEQLEILAKQIDIDCLPIIRGQKPLEIAKRALQEAKLGGYDAMIFDTAGRLHTDQELMEEIKQLSELITPHENILVLDSMTGQDAVNVGKEFQQHVHISGVILTRMDGDARGGAALSMRAILQCPIRFAGMGEKIPEFEEFIPERAASRILDMGDVVSLVEKAADVIGEQEMEALSKKIQRGSFDMDDLLSQLRSINKMGSISNMIGMIPGLGKFKNMVPDEVAGHKAVNRQIVIISSMTLAERKNPDIINPSRKNRIAKGAGVHVHDVNRLLKQHAEMKKMVKKIGKMDAKQISRMGNKFGLSGK